MDMTQTELAELLKVTPQAVSRWEMGVSYPDIAMVPLIAEALKVSADELLGISSMEEPVSGELWVKVSDLNRMNPGKPGVENEKEELPLNQSQVDAVFDYAPAPASGESRRVLAVDDSNFMRKMLEDILTQNGHTFVGASDGQEGLEILKNQEVDVCVLDIRMPGIDGLEVLKRIKEEWAGIRVVMLSACCSEDIVKRARQLGADAFVVKPFQAECLVNRVG